MGLRWVLGFAPVLVLNQTTVMSSFVTQPNWTGQEPCLWKVIPSRSATALQSATLRITLSIEHSVPPSPICAIPPDVVKVVDVVDEGRLPFGST